MKHRTIINIFTGLALAAAVAVIALISIILTGKSHLYNAADRIVQGNNCDGDKTNEAVIFNREPYVYKKGLINILVLGIDGEGNLYDNHSPGDMGQSDAVYVVSIDTQSKATHVVGIPRDTMTTIEMSDKDGNTVAVNTGQVTLQYGYGQDIQQCTSLMAKSVSGILYNIHIDRVVVLSVNSIAIINDAVGGVTVTIENDFTDESGEVLDEAFVKGNTIHLTGEQARLFVQERDCNVAESAMDRLSRQEQYMQALEQLLYKKVRKNPFLIMKIIKELKSNDMLYTDMTNAEIVYVFFQIAESDFNMDSIITIPGKVKKGIRYEEYYTDNESLKKLIMQIFYLPVD